MKNIQHNTKQWYRNVFSGPKLEINKKNGEQLKHMYRNIMNEILWIYGMDNDNNNCYNK